MTGPAGHGVPPVVIGLIVSGLIFAGVSFSGSTVNDTSPTGRPRSSCPSFAIAACIIGHWPAQRVKTKSAIQICPRVVSSEYGRPC